MHPGDTNPSDYGIPPEQNALYQIREANPEMESSLRDPRKAEFVSSPAKRAYYPDEEVERLDESVSNQSRSKSRQGAKLHHRDPVNYYDGTDKIPSDIRIPTVERNIGNVGSFDQQHSNQGSPSMAHSPLKQQVNSTNQIQIEQNVGSPPANNLSSQGKTFNDRLSVPAEPAMGHMVSDPFVEVEEEVYRQSDHSDLNVEIASNMKQ